MNCRRGIFLALLLCMVLASWIPAGSADSGKFRVGATRIDVTPPQEELPKPYLAVFERIYARTIGGISEDIGTTIIQRIQAISPYANTFVVSQFFGPARYLVSDDTYGLFTFDSTDSRVKKGCAEQSILKGFQQLMPK